MVNIEKIEVIECNSPTLSFGEKSEFSKLRVELSSELPDIHETRPKKRKKRNHTTISDLMMNFYWLRQLLNQTRQQETAFQVAAPSEWNNLPKSLRLENDLKYFKTKLKTFLFQKAYYYFINFLLFSIYITLTFNFLPL